MARDPANRVGSRSLDRDPATGRVLPSRARVDDVGNVHWYRADGKPLGPGLQQSLTDSFRGKDRDRYRFDLLKAIAQDPLKAPRIPGEGDWRARKGARGAIDIPPVDWSEDTEDFVRLITGGSGDPPAPHFGPTRLVYQH